MKKLAGSTTILNLMQATARKAHNYLLFSSFAQIARAEGHEQLAEIFAGKGTIEQSHACYFYSLLSKQLDPVEDDHETWSAFFNQLAQVAEAEGFTNIGSMYTILLSGEKAS
jgi:rubrerythrin